MRRNDTTSPELGIQTEFDGRWKRTFDVELTLMENDHQWKMTFDERPPWMEDIL